ncbi:unnamed protein product [Adineta ricciae]|uniref:Uncharacterized protein n=1 Tax=Adineta ricciae TaxID=249248 RepID=A0A815EGG7_ADIRI|nr:unnamed protein product [Adineta ricciae]CAF1311097.1 unnamed protein product [Adineta ricciae]
MSSQIWPTTEPSKVNSLWYRPLQPSREESSLTKLEEMLDQTRRQCLEKGVNLPFPGKADVDSAEDDEDADEAEEESEGGEPDDEVDAQQALGSPGIATGAPPLPLDL